METTAAPSLLSLPFEIISDIVNNLDHGWCPQKDYASLALVNRFFFSLLAPHLSLADSIKHTFSYLVPSPRRIALVSLPHAPQEVSLLPLIDRINRLSDVSSLWPSFYQVSSSFPECLAIRALTSFTFSLDAQNPDLSQFTAKWIPLLAQRFNNPRFTSFSVKGSIKDAFAYHFLCLALPWSSIKSLSLHGICINSDLANSISAMKLTSLQLTNCLFLDNAFSRLVTGLDGNKSLKSLRLTVPYGTDSSCLFKMIPHSSIRSLEIPNADYAVSIEPREAIKGIKSSKLTQIIIPCCDWSDDAMSEFLSSISSTNLERITLYNVSNLEMSNIKALFKGKKQSKLNAININVIDGSIKRLCSRKRELSALGKLNWEVSIGRLSWIR